MINNIKKMLVMAWKKVSFKAKKRISRPVTISFKSGGKRISFVSKKRITVPVKVTFYIKTKKKDYHER